MVLTTEIPEIDFKEKPELREHESQTSLYVEAWCSKKFVCSIQFNLTGDGFLSFLFKITLGYISRYFLAILLKKSNLTLRNV